MTSKAKVQYCPVQSSVFHSACGDIVAALISPKLDICVFQQYFFGFSETCVSLHRAFADVHSDACMAYKTGNTDLAARHVAY